MRIAKKYLEELIANDGQLLAGPVHRMGVLRLALDLREAREQIAQLEVTLGLQGANAPKPSVPAASTKTHPKSGSRIHVVEEVVTNRFGDPRGNDYEETQTVIGSKVDYRA